MSDNQELENQNTSDDSRSPEELLQSLEADQSKQSASISDEKPAAQDMSKQEYSITVGGKEVKGTIEQLQKWASMGYDAPNRIGQLQKQLEGWKQKETQLSELQKKYGAVDDYVRQNPQWWDFVSKQYEQLNQSMSENNPLLQELNSLKATVQDLAQYKNQIVTQQEDSAYNEELNAIKKQFPKLDFSTPDENGKSLEYKVLEHAKQNGINKFTAAFRDFYHDELMKIKAEEAKEAVIKDKQAKSKLGVVSVSPQPSTTKTLDHRGKSYNQLAEEALKMYGLT